MITLKEFYQRCACGSQLRVMPDEYTQITGDVCDPEYQKRLQEYENMEVSVITALRDDDIKVILSNWTEED